MDVATLGLLGYGAIGGLVLLDSMIPVLPAEAVLLATAAGTDRSLPLVALILVAMLGALVGDVLMHCVGLRLADRPQTKWQRRWGHRTIERTSTSVIIAGRFLPLGRTAVAVASGVARVPWPRYLVACGIGTGIWSVATVALGRIGGTVTENTAARIAIGLGLGLLVTSTLALVRGRRPQRTA